MTNPGKPIAMILHDALNIDGAHLHKLLVENGWAPPDEERPTSVRIAGDAPPPVIKLFRPSDDSATVWIYVLGRNNGMVIKRVRVNSVAGITDQQMDYLNLLLEDILIEP